MVWQKKTSFLCEPDFDNVAKNINANNNWMLSYWL